MFAAVLSTFTKDTYLMCEVHIWVPRADVLDLMTAMIIAFRTLSCPVESRFIEDAQAFYAYYT